MSLRNMLLSKQCKHILPTARLFEYLSHTCCYFNSLPNWIVMLMTLITSSIQYGWMEGHSPSFFYLFPSTVLVYILCNPIQYVFMHHFSTFNYTIALPEKFPSSHHWLIVIACRRPCRAGDLAEQETLPSRRPCRAGDLVCLRYS